MLLNKELNILEEFSEDYSKKIYGRKVAEKLKLNQKTTSNILSKLEKESILKFTQEGRNKYYFLNKLNPNIKDIIKIVEINKKITFLEKNKKLSRLFKKLEERAAGILAIFGSYAQGKNMEKSDLDIFTIGKLENIEDLEKLYNIKINIIKSSKEKFDKEENLIKEIIKNHVIINGVEEFIDLIW